MFTKKSEKSSVNFKGPPMADPQKLEDEVAELIAENVTVGYTLGPGGLVDPDTIFVLANGAAHVVIHRLKQSQL